MPNINTEAIPGYSEMSAEEKVAALESFEYDDHAAELERSQRAVTKANGEAAEWKRKHNALLSEDEQARVAREEEVNTLRSQAAEAQRQLSVLTHKMQLTSLGYDETLAASTAEAFADGDLEKVFANQKAFLEAHDKKLKADLLKGTPTPPAGNGSTGVTLEQFRKWDEAERHKFSIEHPDEYRRLYGGI